MNWDIQKILLTGKACSEFRHRNALNMICWLSPMISCLVTCHMGKSVPAITDDAMIVEYGSDTKVKLIEGSYENIKVTTPEDMGITRTFFKETQKNVKKLEISVDIL